MGIAIGQKASEYFLPALHCTFGNGKLKDKNHEMAGAACMMNPGEKCRLSLKQSCGGS
jgi:hypothetical protein